MHRKSGHGAVLERPKHEEKRAHHKPPAHEKREAGKGLENFWGKEPAAAPLPANQSTGLCVHCGDPVDAGQNYVCKKHERFG